MAERSHLWRELTAKYLQVRIAYPALKSITLAQWAHESHWGTSNLAVFHYNFGGLNYRRGMRRHARPVSFQSSDGIGIYCHFSSIATFIRGYWHFIDRGRYDGWRDYAKDPEGYIGLIASCGYATDSDYRAKVLILHDQILSEIPALGYCHSR